MGGQDSMAPDIWTNFTAGIPEYATESFAALDPWFYPLLFLGFIGYIYGCMNSVTSAIIAILMTLGIFAVTTSIFEQTTQMTQLLYIITVLGLTMLIVRLISKNRRYV